ncbi:MAG: HAD family hydrolase [Anaerolineae bacterium]
MKPTLLFFDLDATLVENRFSRKAIAPLLQELATTADRTIETIYHEFMAENLRRQEVDPDNVLTMDWDDILQHLARQHDVTLSDTVDQRWQEYAHADDVEILDNAPAVLKMLQRPHRQLILSTKGLFKYQESVLDVTGLGAFFDDILTPDITGYLKTTPAYFERYQAQDALKIQIGDHYYDDVICARAKGFYSIMRAPLPALEIFDPFERPQQLADLRADIPTYPDTETDIVPDAVVISLEELPSVIQRFEARSAS